MGGGDGAGAGARAETQSKRASTPLALFSRPASRTAYPPALHGGLSSQTCLPARMRCHVFSMLGLWSAGRAERYAQRVLLLLHRTLACLRGFVFLPACVVNAGTVECGMRDAQSDTTFCYGTRSEGVDGGRDIHVDGDANQDRRKRGMYLLLACPSLYLCFKKKSCKMLTAAAHRS